MLVTLAGMTILDRDQQSANAKSPMLVIPSEITILFKDLQL